MVIEELYTRLGFQVDPQGIDKGKQLLSGFKNWVGGLAIGAGFTLLAKTGIDAAMTIESLNAQFTVMAGSAERSRDLLADISDFAAKTPFSKLGLADAGKTLMAFGLEAELCFHGIEHAQGLSHNLRADTIARQNCNLVGVHVWER